MKEKSNAFRILMVVTICFLNIAFAAGYIYWRLNHNTYINVKDASRNLPAILEQDMITVLFPILLFAVYLYRLRGDFSECMYLKIKNKQQAFIVMILSAAAGILLAYALVVKEDRITILYSFFYYFFVVAFCEEFVIRGVCVYIIDSFPKVYRYLIPNICFAFMHIFSYSEWTAISAEYVLRFLTQSVMGLVVAGCLFQLAKEKSGTLWTPVLIHAMLDFSAVFE